jgi:cell wall-associated NlpC family hydrolase
MFLRKLFPCVLAAWSILALSLTVTAQSADVRARQVTQQDDPNEITCSPDDLVIISEAPPEDIKAAYPTLPANPTFSAKLPGDATLQLLTSAIDQRLGSRYRWGGTGPNGFDCSGFVWSIFQAAGISFERGSARNLWGRFEAPAPEEKFKFGTLVFFSGLAHVGVVVDEHGFYHASRHHGVVYSPFNDYWVSRIDGFRKVPMPITKIAKITD